MSKSTKKVVKTTLKPLAAAMQKAGAKFTGNTVTIAQSMKRADRAAGTMLAECQGIATSILEHLQLPKDMPFQARYKLATSVARLAFNEGAPRSTLKQADNVIAAINRFVCIGLAPDVPVEIKAASGDNGAVLKPAAECTSARQVNAAVRTIKETMGATDGRTNNAPKEKPLHQRAETARTVKALLKTTAGISAIQKWAAELGKVVTVRQAVQKSKGGAQAVAKRETARAKARKPAAKAG